MLNLTANGTTFIPGIVRGSLFTIAASGTFDGATLAIQYPITGPVAAELDLDDDDETPGMTITATKPGTDANNISVEILAATGYQAAIAMAIDYDGGDIAYAFQPATDAGTASALTTSLTGTHNDLTFTARAVGTAGDSISLTYVNPSANNAALGVVVTGTDIVVNLATGVAGAITTTANELRQAVIESAAARALVTVAFASANDGTGVVTALTKTNLSGGIAPVISSTAADLAAYINAHCAGAFTAALATDGAGLLVATAATNLAGGTNGTFQTYTAAGATLTAGGDIELRNVGGYDGIALTVTNADTATDIDVAVTKVRVE